MVAHFVNSNWQLEKKIIGLRLIDVSHSGENIAERLLAVLEDKVFAITLDNASANSNWIMPLLITLERLSPRLAAYVCELFFASMLCLPHH